MRDLQFDAGALLVSLAQGAGQLQQRLAQALLAVHRHQIGDNLVLLGDAHRQISDKSLQQQVATQAAEKQAAWYFLEDLYC